MEFGRSEKKTLVLLVVVILILLLAFSLWKYHKKTSINEETLSVFTVEEGEAPYSDLYGKPVALDTYLGQPLVVVSWASWSPFSEGDIKMLSELSQEYSQAGFMAINRKEPKEQAQRYVNSIGDTPGVLIVLDPRDEFYNAVGGYAMPELVIYDRSGEIVLHERGVANKDLIKATLNSLLNK